MRENFTGSEDAVLAAVYEAVDRLNEMSPPDRRVPKNPDTRLVGSGGYLDSLGAVNLIVETEQAERQNRRVTIRRITPLLSGGPR